MSDEDDQWGAKSFHEPWIFIICMAQNELISEKLKLLVHQLNLHFTEFYSAVGIDNNIMCSKYF